MKIKEEREMTNEGSVIEFEGCKYIICKDYGDMALISSLALKQHFLLFQCPIVHILPCTGKNFSRYVRLEKGELIFNGVHFPVNRYDTPSCNVKNLESNLHGKIITFSIVERTKELMLVKG